MKHLDKLEAVLWSVALPGFAQLLGGQFLKGALFVLLEFVTNVQSNFNEAIRLSFLGETRAAAEVIDYGWLMFYPCLYFFAMWDAYRSAMPKDEKYSYLPFAFSAYFVTVGLMYSIRVEWFGLFIGPIFFPMLSVIPGLAVGFLIRTILLKWKENPHA
ncbi:hypothetical protein SAMN05877753_10869 [Bacillus oleivorans]|uniref:Uncharacterized protein n=1 Tax=Bacillus oleivorans TaxID=1448271 RepID=A0A285D2E3_9BACI|nr:hypothetical protein [Bacillus oleivorans]SNX73981.1 hypothetical protein SAMN05877753_10869 [Bacillus oleivorans]